MLRPLIALFSLLMVSASAQSPSEPAGLRQVSETGIRHGMLILGADTQVIDADGKILRTYPLGTRDGFMLPNGNLVLAITKCDTYPGGGAVEVDKDNKILWEYKGTQSEVNTVQKLSKDRYLLTEAGPRPRVLEVDAMGKVVVDMPIQAQTNDFHLQTRMTRKLRNGHYLVPQLLDKLVREYTPDGKVVWEVATPNWPFTAIRLDNGHTLIDCTHGDMVIEVDKAGKTVWQVTNADLPGGPIHDACGGQRLANGNTVITAYGSGGVNDIKLMEITPEKKIVWAFYTGRNHGIHEFQILTPEGTPLKEKPQK